MNRERIQIMIDKLPTIPEASFDMRWWAAKDPGCGTICCAMGWAAHEGWFEDLKLEHAVGVGYVELIPEQGPPMEGLEAAAALFEIPYEAAAALFFDFVYREPTVASVVRRLTALRDGGLVMLAEDLIAHGRKGDVGYEAVFNELERLIEGETHEKES